MRKILATLALVLLTWSVSYGAASDDVYVRKDVFDAKMEAFMSEMRNGFQMLNAKIDAQSQRTDDKFQSLEARMDEKFRGVDEKFQSLETRMNERFRSVDDKFQSLETRMNEGFRGVDDKIQNLDTRISDLRNGIYLWLVAIGLVATWPKVREIFRSMSSSSPSITLEDVKRLIAENNAELLKTLKA